MAGWQPKYGKLWQPSFDVLRRSALGETLFLADTDITDTVEFDNFSESEQESRFFIEDVTGWYATDFSQVLFTDESGTEQSFIGDDVGRWASLSENPLADARQADPALHPSLVGVGNKVAARFSNSDLSCENFDIARNVNGFAVMGIYSVASTGSTNSVLSITTSTASFNRIFYGVHSTGDFEAGGRRLDSDSFSSDRFGSVTTDELVCHVAIFDYQNARLIQYLNTLGGPTRDVAFQTAGTTSDTDSASISIGGGVPTSTTDRFDGDIYELILLDYVPTQQVVSDFMIHARDYWGVTI